ncbi:MAG: FeoA family protein [Corynebacterium sp.]|nr:FeoA family protein [Corynebacterium sp.]
MSGCNSDRSIFIINILERTMVSSEIPLIELPKGQSGVISSVSEEAFSQEMNLRLRELGLRVGAEVTTIMRTSGGGRMVKIDRTRYAMDKKTAQLIHVSPTAQGGQL